MRVAGTVCGGTRCRSCRAGACGGVGLVVVVGAGAVRLRRWASFCLLRPQTRLPAMPALLLHASYSHSQSTSLCVAGKALPCRTKVHFRVGRHGEYKYLPVMDVPLLVPRVQLSTLDANSNIAASRPQCPGVVLAVATLQLPLCRSAVARTTTCGGGRVPCAGRGETRARPWLCLQRACLPCTNSVLRGYVKWRTRTRRGRGLCVFWATERGLSIQPRRKRREAGKFGRD